MIHENDEIDDNDESTGGAPAPRFAQPTMRGLTHLAAAMAHEVRNPLNSLAIHAELLETRFGRAAAMLPAGERDAILRSLRTLSSEIDRIDRILEQYLAIAGPDEPARAHVAPRQVIDAAFSRVAPAAAAAGVELVAAGDHEERWSLDVEAMVEALEAVIAHAVKSTPRGGRIAVEVVDSEVEGYGEIQIRDGASQTAEALQHLFHLATDRDPALAIAKQIVKSHAGSLTAQPADAGTVYTIRLAVD